MAKTSNSAVNELTLHTPSGSQTTFEFSAGFDIRGLCRAIAARIL